jgi:hypothetical protein
MGGHRMSYLQVIDDERELTIFLCGELGAKLLLTDFTVAGEASVADDPCSALPAKLPTVATFGSVDVRTLVFWLPACGPIKTMGDAPAPKTPRDRVARHLTREAATDGRPCAPSGTRLGPRGSRLISRMVNKSANFAPRSVTTLAKLAN